MSGCGCEVELKDAKQKYVLYWLLGINAVMFCVEITVGLYANSTALIADSMDMLADAIVYGIALYAVSRSLKHKANAALISGYFQLTLGLLIIFDIVRRILGEGEPHSWFMIGFGFIALIANVICLVLIRKHNNGEVHMRASWIFSANDVIALSIEHNIQFHRGEDVYFKNLLNVSKFKCPSDYSSSNDVRKSVSLAKRNSVLSREKLFLSPSFF